MNFVRCGLLGWCIEIFWTGIHGFKNKDKKLMGNTSLLMFPIYGLACSIRHVYKLIKNNCFIIRGCIYTIGIFFVEFTSGYMLKKKDKCPWDYSNCKYSILGLIRLDYAPLWFITGLFFEKVLDTSNSGSHTHQQHIKNR